MEFLVFFFVRSFTVIVPHNIEADFKIKRPIVWVYMISILKPVLNTIRTLIFLILSIDKHETLKCTSWSSTLKGNWFFRIWNIQLLCLGCVVILWTASTSHFGFIFSTEKNWRSKMNFFVEMEARVDVILFYLFEYKQVRKVVSYERHRNEKKSISHSLKSWRK